MICTEQERDALKRILAVLKPILTDHKPPIAIDWVGRGAIAVGQEFESAINAVREHKDADAIRAMLAPPDDAVLREEAVKLVNDEASSFDWLGTGTSSYAAQMRERREWSEGIVDSVIAVLRGEATRDE